MPAPTLTIVFALYPGVTHLDFTGPHQVLCRLPGARVIAASETGEPIEAEGLTFANLTRLADAPACDVLCVPGGSGTTAAMQDKAFMAQIERLAVGARYVTSVCTGSLMARPGCCAASGRPATGRRATCCRCSAPSPTMAGWRDGNLFTGGGVTAGIDFAEHYVAVQQNVLTHVPRHET